MGAVRCCWKPWWTRLVFAGPAIAPPTGSTSGGPPGAVAWIATTKLIAKRSKTSTSIRWSAMSGSSYVEIRSGKQIRIGEFARHDSGDVGKLVNQVDFDRWRREIVLPVMN